ncbi:hypothetical protein RFI_03073, partial [Reticulomyxa filosa]
MSYKTFLCLEKKMHEVTLASINLKSLEERILELLKTNNKTRDPTSHFKIIDNNGQEITNDQQLEIAFRARSVFFFIHFIHKNEKKESEDEYHKIMNPLVLLTGAARYNSLDYLPGVKVDLMMFRNLFEGKYGYKVYCTYDPNKPETESLTLNELNIFLNKHYSNLINDNNYDSLIFVWCGHGNTAEEGDTLITSDNDKYKLFKKVQELFANDTDVFLNKPKIFIKNACRGNKQSQQRKIVKNEQWHNYASDTFIISSTILEKLRFDSEGSYFTECFCNVMSQNITSLKLFNDNLMLVSKMVKQKALSEQNIQCITTSDRHVFLYNRNHLSNANIEIDQNHLWIKANKKAHEIMNEMINNKQQGIIV